MTSTTLAEKICVHCHKDVAHGPRMRDHLGHYWCIECGSEDSRRKHTGGQHCIDCRGKYDITQLKLESGEWVCQGCIALREKARRAALLGGKESSAPADRGAQPWVVVTGSVLVMAACVLVARMALI